MNQNRDIYDRTRLLALVAHHMTLNYKAYEDVYREEMEKERQQDSEYGEEFHRRFLRKLRRMIQRDLDHCFRENFGSMVALVEKSKRIQNRHGKFVLVREDGFPVDVEPLSAKRK